MIVTTQVVRFIVQGSGLEPINPKLLTPLDRFESEISVGSNDIIQLVRISNELIYLC